MISGQQEDTGRKPSAKDRARAAFLALNERQQTYLTVIYQADQDEQEWQNGAYLRGDEQVPASVWRWLEYDPTRRRRRGATAERGLLQAALDRLEIRDDGSGRTLKALADRELIEIRYASGDRHANRMAIKLTTRGRAVARAGGADETRPGRRNKQRPLSEGLWRMLVDVAAAEIAGREAFSPRGISLHPAWERLEELGMVAIDRSSHHIRRTPQGREHYARQWEEYARSYPSVNAPRPDGRTVWPAEVDLRLSRLAGTVVSLRIESAELVAERKALPAVPVRPPVAGVDAEVLETLRVRRTQLLSEVCSLVDEQVRLVDEAAVAAVWRYLAVAAAVVTAVGEGRDPAAVLDAEPVVVATTADLPFPRVGVKAVDRDIAVMRPGTSLRRRRQGAPEEVKPVSVDEAFAYARGLAGLVTEGWLTRVLLREQTGS